MANERLISLLRLRQREVEAARRHLGECLTLALQAARALQEIEDSIQADRRSEALGDDRALFLDIIARHASVLSDARDSAQAALADAEARAAAARAVVAEARAAAEAVETLVAERAAAAAAEAARREQHGLDDLARVAFAAEQTG